MSQSDISKNIIKDESLGSKQTLKGKIVSFFLPRGIEREMLRYRSNKPSQMMTFVALACVIAAFSTVYGYIKTVTWFTGVDIFFSIFMMLFSFLATERLKSYSRSWSYVVFGLAALSLIRAFTYPVTLHTPDATGKVVLDTVRFTIVVSLYIISAFFYVLAGVLCLYRGRALRSFIKSSQPIENEIIKEKK